jgi:hypothetical protein
MPRPPWSASRCGGLGHERLEHRPEAGRIVEMDVVSSPRPRHTVRSSSPRPSGSPRPGPGRLDSLGRRASDTRYGATRPTDRPRRSDARRPRQHPARTGAGARHRPPQVRLPRRLRLIRLRRRSQRRRGKGTASATSRAIVEPPRQRRDRQSDWPRPQQVPARPLDDTRPLRWRCCRRAIARPRSERYRARLLPRPNPRRRRPERRPPAVTRSSRGRANPRR